MEETNFFVGLLLSLFSPKFYRETAQKWRGRAYLALLTTLAIFWLLTLIMGTVHLAHSGKKFIAGIAEQVPVMQLSNGLLSSSSPGPTKIYLPNSKTVLAIIDTKGKIGTPEKADAAIYISSQNVYIKSKKNQTDQYSFPKTIPTGQIGPNQVNKILTELLNRVMLVGGLIIFLAGIILTYLIAMLISLIVSIIGILFALIMKRETHFGDLYHLSLMFWTPSLLIGLILMLFSIYAFWIYLLFPLLYMIYGVISLPKKL